MPGGWEGSNRRDELPPDWDRIRARIKRRDGYRCTETLPDGSRCTEVATDVDHIVPGNDHSDPNLRSLCGPHHDKKSSAEGNAARWARKGARRRPPLQHPGRAAGGAPRGPMGSPGPR